MPAPTVKMWNLPRPLYLKSVLASDVLVAEADIVRNGATAEAAAVQRLLEYDRPRQDCSAANTSTRGFYVCDSLSGGSTEGSSRA